MANHRKRARERPPAHRSADDGGRPLQPRASHRAPQSHRLRATAPSGPGCGLQCPRRPRLFPAASCRNAPRGDEWNGLRRHSDITAADSAIAQQAAGDELGGVDSDGEANSLCWQDRRSVDADHVSARVDQRTAGIPGIQRRISLNDIFDEPARVGAQRSSERADHARGYGRLESIRIANGNRHLARPQVLRICRARRAADPVNIDSNHGKIGGRIVANGVRGSAPPSASVTSMRVASCTTWLLVRIKPSGCKTKPEPPPRRSRGSPRPARPSTG